MEFKNYKLEELITEIIDNRGKNPNNYHDKGKYFVLDNYLVKNNYHPDLKDVKRYIDEETYSNFLRGYIHKNMPIMTLVGNGIGNVTLCPSEEVVIIQNTIGFKTNNLLDQRYLFYYFIKQNKRLKSFNRGSGQPSIKKTDILNMSISIPSLQNQKKIVKILSDIDKKIELNNQISNNLQKTSQELYKRWFVDFEFPNEEGKPYKSSGGEMRESELGEIPEGWEVGNLGDILETNKRGCSPKYTDDHDGIPVINQRCIRDGIIIEEAVKYHDKSKLISEDLYFKKYDILINSMGVGTLGRVSQVSFSNEERLIHSCITILRSKPHIYDQLILGSAAKEMQSLFESMGNGTTGQTSLNNKEISNLKIVIPPLNLQKKLSKILKNNLDKITANYYENKSLINLRDTLLPKLLNGEIDLEQIEV